MRAKLAPMRPALLALALLLGGCAFTFIPLVPEAIALPPRLEFGGETTLERVAGELVLTARLRRVPEQGYLSAFLYREDEKVAEDSRLVDPDTREVEFRFSLARLGRYRALLFWDGETVRQLETEIR